MQERQTKQKATIYDALCSLDHPTATEVYAKLQQTNPTISRATVFRVLSGFASGGKALELRMAGSDVRYDFNTAEHYHVHCKRCGRVADVRMPKAAKMPKVITKEGEGFLVEGYSVEFIGVCPKCQG
ncbi:MAG: transcriptional repressor [Clostridia bacterium]|nr:transcriptional repressor [Clostridia bacterium]